MGTSHGKRRTDMKRSMALLLVAAVLVTVIALAGCTDTTNDDNGKLKIISTIFPSYDFARSIVMDKADVTMLLKPGMESHSYDPTPQDIINIRNCDIFIYCGGESDEWVDEILSSGQKPDMVIAMMDCVSAVEEETVEGMTEEKNDSDEIEYDEHVWTSPKNAVLITEEISKAVCKLDKENEDFYQKQTDKYIKKLNSLDQSIRNTIGHAVRNTIVFGDRFPFRYLADEYGLNYYAAFPGCSAETEPSAATISFLIDKVKEEKIPVVFTIEFSNGKVADTICDATGAKILKMHSCHNLSAEEMESGKTYISLMNNNITNLREALS